MKPGPWVVGPTHLIGGSKKRTVHVAGGQMQFSTRDGRRYFRESHGHMNENLPDVAAGLSRTECDFIEFHCMLVWTDALRRLGPLDEALLSTSEHLDFCIQVKDAGGGVYHEPASTVVYVPHFLMPWSDVRYFLLRWSDEWNRSSLRHFQTKHGIADDDCFLSGRYAWLNSHRRWPMRFFTKPVKWIFGKSISEALDRRLDPLILVLTPKERRRQIQVGPFPWTDMAGH